MNEKKEDREMRPEYDFSKAERGKFHRPLSGGYKVYVRHNDGSEIVKHFSNMDLNEERIRFLCAERGLNWDDMTEKQREEFVDMLLHEK